MDFYVADTHALFWYLTASPRLGANAKNAFDDGVKGDAVIYIPAIVLAELFFLNEKFTQPLILSRNLNDSSKAHNLNFSALSLTT